MPGERVRTLRVLLVDDHEPFRGQLRAWLDGEPDMLVVAEAGDGLAAVQLAGELQPDLVIMDVAMPHLGGIEATRRIMEACPTIKVLALSMFRNRKFVDGMLAAGAVGYVLKENALLQLPSALRAVTRGDIYLCPELS